MSGVFCLVDHHDAFLKRRHVNPTPPRRPEELVREPVAAGVGPGGQHLLPLRVVQEIGLLLVTTYTPFAARIIRLDQQKHNVGQAMRQALDEGFASIAGK